MKKLSVGVIGCGKISGTYLGNCKKFPNLIVSACADINSNAAKEKAAEFGIKRVLTVDEMLADDSIRAVLNLTVPKAHTAVNLAALEAGKHVYVEKPLALDRQEAEQVLARARSKNLLVGCAPDTFLGAGLQTCRKLIDDGVIGAPHSATAFMICGGHESWHPSPEFYYEKGGGPMFDMGPYYLTALVSLLGPVAEVSAMTHCAFQERVITSEPKHGRRIKVEVPTTVFGHMKFSSGALGSIVTTFDAKGGTTLPRIEIYGSTGTIVVPDPNTFGGPVLVQKEGQEKSEERKLLFAFSENSRGLGLSDMARAIATGRNDARASGTLANHVLDIMLSFHEAAEQGRMLRLASTCANPQPMPVTTQARQYEWFLQEEKKP